MNKIDKIKLREAISNTLKKYTMEDREAATDELVEAVLLLTLPASSSEWRAICAAHCEREQAEKVRVKPLDQHESSHLTSTSQATRLNPSLAIPLNHPSRALSKEKIKEITENTERRILEGLRGAQASWPGREKMPEIIRDLLDVFVSCTGQKPLRDQQMDWLGTGQDWLEAGIRADDIRAAYEKSKPDQNGRGGFMVNRPGSLTRTAQMIAGQRHSTHSSGTQLERAMAEIAEMTR